MFNLSSRRQAIRTHHTQLRFARKKFGAKRRATNNVSEVSAGFKRRLEGAFKNDTDDNITEAEAHEMFIDTNENNTTSVDEIRKGLNLTVKGRLKSLKEELEHYDLNVYQARLEIREEDKARQRGTVPNIKWIEEKIKQMRAQRTAQKKKRLRTVQVQGRNIKISRSTRSER